MSQIITPGGPIRSAQSQKSSKSAPQPGDAGGNSTGSDQPVIVDITMENINDVLSLSATTPVLMDFWADWCEPCKALMPIVEKLANDYKGAFVLAKVNADEHPMIAQQLGVRGLPTLRLLKQGQFVEELTGAQTEEAVKSMLDKHVEAPEADDDSENDALIKQIKRARRLGAYPEALAALKEAIEKNPKHYEYQKWLAYILIDQKDFDGAETVVENLPSGEAARTAAAARLQFARISEALPSKEALASQLTQLRGADEKKGENSDEIAELIYNLGVQEVIAEAYSTALDHFMDLAARYSSYRDELGRKSLLLVFDLLGPNEPLAKQYRRKLFAMLH